MTDSLPGTVVSLYARWALGAVRRVLAAGRGTTSAAGRGAVNRDGHDSIVRLVADLMRELGVQA